MKLPVIYHAGPLTAGSLAMPSYQGLLLGVALHDHGIGHGHAAGTHPEAVVLTPSGLTGDTFDVVVAAVVAAIVVAAVIVWWC